MLLSSYHIDLCSNTKDKNIGRKSNRQWSLCVFSHRFSTIDEMRFELFVVFVCVRMWEFGFVVWFQSASIFVFYYANGNEKCFINQKSPNIVASHYISAMRRIQCAKYHGMFQFGKLKSWNFESGKKNPKHHEPFFSLSILSRFPSITLEITEDVPMQ